MSDYIYVSDTDRLKAMVEELESYLDEEREKNEKQVRMTMDSQAENKRLRAEMRKVRPGLKAVFDPELWTALEAGDE